MNPARLLLFILCAFLSSGSALAQQATLSGTVSDSKGHRVAGASLTIAFDGSSIPFQGSAVADDDGRFELSGLWPGEYTFEVQAYGFRKWMELKRHLQPGSNTLEVILEEISPSPDREQAMQDVEVVTGSPIGVREYGEKAELETTHSKPLDTLSVNISPGVSLKILAERLRPFAGISSESLLAQFNELSNGFRADESKSDVRATLLVGTLKRRQQMSRHLEESLNRFDLKYDTRLNLAPADSEDHFSGLSSDVLRKRLQLELAGYSHYVDTLLRLRGIVAELVRRDELDSGEAAKYLAFLLRNGLTGHETKVDLIDSVVPDIAQILQNQQDLQENLKRFAGPSRSWISLSGIALGFLEAAPAETTQQLVVPGNIRLTRKFTPITGHLSDPTVVYKIRLWIDPPDLRPGITERAYDAEVQTIAVDGRLESASWTFEMIAAGAFGQVQLPFYAELREYRAGSEISRQRIEVPVSLVTIFPGPTWQDKLWARFKNIFGSVAGLISLILAFTLIFVEREKLGRHLRLRKYIEIVSAVVTDMVGVVKRRLTRR